jgi:hypothetical protein
MIGGLGVAGATAVGGAGQRCRTVHADQGGAGNEDEDEQGTSFSGHV